MKKVTRFLAKCLVLAALGVFPAACMQTTSGAVRDDSTLTGTSKQLQITSDVSQYRAPKLRVGVINFQNKTPSRVPGIGESAADILGTLLQKTGRFIVIPQQDMQSILLQQLMGATGAINPETAAKMGQIMGLNAVVTGIITAYSDTEEAAVFGTGGSKKQTARVTLEYRIVDTTTGVQLVADSGQGVYEKKATQALSMESKDTYDTDLRDGALRDALTRVMITMMQQLGNRRWSSRIASFSGNTLYINAGQKSGLNVGDKLDVYREGEEIIDPDNKQKIGTKEDFIGSVVVIRNDLGDQTDLSVVQPTSGTGFKKGDIVRISTR